MERARQGTPIARPLDGRRIADLDREATQLSQRTVLGAMRRSAVRRALHRVKRDHQLDKAASNAWAHRAALVVVMGQMLRLRCAGATLAELLRFGEALLRFARTLAGDDVRELRLLDLEETRLSGRENDLQTRRLLMPRTPVAIAEEIEAREQLIGVYSEQLVALHAELRKVLPTQRGMRFA